MNIQRFERWVARQRSAGKSVDGYLPFAKKLAEMAGTATILAADVDAAIVKAKADGVTEMGLARLREVGRAILEFERDDQPSPDEGAPVAPDEAASKGPRPKRKRVRRGQSFNAVDANRRRSYRVFVTGDLLEFIDAGEASSLLYPAGRIGGLLMSSLVSGARERAAKTCSEIDDTRSFDWLSSRYPGSFQVLKDDVRAARLAVGGFWIELDNGKQMEFLFADPGRDAPVARHLLPDALESKLEIGHGVDLSRGR